jgi:two-component system, LytTR family, response regulator
MNLNDFDPKIRVVVIEDENDIRQWLIARLQTFSEIEVVGEAISVDSAFKMIASKRPDALFLDIKIVGGDAFDLLRKLKAHDLPIPNIVMTTAFPEFAVEAINENFSKYIKKYVVKPFVDDWERILRDAIDALLAVSGEPNLVQNLANSPQNAAKTSEIDFIFLKKEGDLVKVFFRDIAFFEAAGEGKIIVATEQGKITIDLTLTKFLENLPPYFRQVSRFHAVNMQKIMRLMREDQGVMMALNGKEKFIGVGESFYGGLLKELPQAKVK